MSQYNNFKLAYELFDDKEFNEQYRYWERRIARSSVGLFEYAQRENPLTLILANHTYFWFNAVKKFVDFYKEYDKRFNKTYLEAYKLCKEIGIEQFNEIVKNEELTIRITAADGNCDDWIKHYKDLSD